MRLAQAAGSAPAAACGQVAASGEAAAAAADGRLLYDPVANATTTAEVLDTAAAAAPPAAAAALRYYFLAPDAAAPQLNWELTYACTWRCRHCLQPTAYVPAPAAGKDGARRAADAAGASGAGAAAPAGGSTGVTTVTDDDLERVVALIRALGAREVSLTGGEVLLVTNLAAVLTRLHDAVPGLSLRVLLSGRGLPQRAAAAGLLSVLAATGACARVPLYGPTPEVHDWVTRVPGSFADVVDFAGLARAAGVRVHVGTQVLRETYPYLAATLRLAEHLSGGDFALSTIIYPSQHGDGSDHGLTADQLTHLLRNAPTAAVATDYLGVGCGQCASGCRYPTIDPAGAVRSCDIAGEPVGCLDDAPASLARGLQGRAAQPAGDCAGCAYAAVCKRCPAFVSDGHCAAGYRARVAVASLVAARRAEAARLLGWQFVDEAAGAALAPPVRPSSDRVSDAGR